MLLECFQRLVRTLSGARLARFLSVSSHNTGFRSDNELFARRVLGVRKSRAHTMNGRRKLSIQTHLELILLIIIITRAG